MHSENGSKASVSLCEYFDVYRSVVFAQTSSITRICSITSCLLDTDYTVKSMPLRGACKSATPIIGMSLYYRNEFFQDIRWYYIDQYCPPLIKYNINNIIQGLSYVLLVEIEIIHHYWWLIQFNPLSTNVGRYFPPVIYSDICVEFYPTLL